MFRTATLRGDSGSPEVTEQLLRCWPAGCGAPTTKMTERMFINVPGRVAKRLLLLAQQFGAQ